MRREELNALAFRMRVLHTRAMEVRTELAIGLGPEHEASVLATRVVSNTAVLAEVLKKTEPPIEVPRDIAKRGRWDKEAKP